MTKKIFDYLNKELKFIRENNGSYVSFFWHILYWQVVFKLYRAVSVKLSEKLDLPFFIHKDKLEIEITTDCNMKCYHCDRSCPQAPSDERMSVEQLRHFIDESVKANKKWPFIVLIGGEPTMHPDIFEICDLFIEYKAKFSQNTKLTVSTNGVSKITKQILNRLPYIIHQENSNKKTSKQTNFDSFNVAPVDLAKYSCHSTDFSKGCNISSLSGTALTRYGFYACGAGASIDRVTGLDIGIKHIKQRSESNFRAQLRELCMYCGHFKSAEEDFFNMEDISPAWQKIYDNYKTQKPLLGLYSEPGYATASSF